LGADEAQLKAIAKSEGQALRPVQEVAIQESLNAGNWRQHFGQKEYTLAFTKFFDDEIAKAGGDWRSVVQEHLFSGKEPLVNGMCGGRKLQPMLRPR
jgi:hypothetical protein